jgi:hypothetical protein
MAEFDPTNPRHREAKRSMLMHVKTCIEQGAAKDLSDAEIERCCSGRCGEGALVIHAKAFRDAGELIVE